MKAEEKYYRKLVEGYLNKTLTKRELTVFFDLLSKGVLDFYLEEDMVANVPESVGIIKPKRRKLSWYSLAASVLLLIGVGLGIFYMESTPEEKGQSTVREVRPGGNQAILTLSNGEQVILDDLEQAEEIRERNISIVNNKAGSIQYDLSKINIEGVEKAELTKKFNTIETPRGGTYQIILPDGSKVWLNSLSKIRFPLAFSSTQRVVEIDGEAFFEVTENRKQPFIVRSRNQEIEVLGTTFNVNSYNDEPFIRTTLLTGRIQLSSPYTSLQLTPGQEILNNNGDLKVQSADVDQAIAWKEGYFRFDKADVSSLMRQISRWYNVNVKFIGHISDERFVGKIKRSGSLDELLKIFKDGGMDVSLSGRTITVRN